MYTFSQDTVVIQATGALAVNAQGVLRPQGGGDALPVYGLSGEPIPFIKVGPTGAHESFRADVPLGDLDFGSVIMTKVADEVLLEAAQANQGLADLDTRVGALEAGTVGGAKRVIALPRRPTPSDGTDGDMMLFNPRFTG